MADDRALGFEHLHAGSRQHHALVGQWVVAPEGHHQVGALDPLQRHSPVLGEAGRADGQRIDPAVDAGVGPVDQAEHGAHVLATTHVLAAVRAVDAVAGGRDLLALGALDPLLGGLVAADCGFGQRLPEIAQVLDEAQGGVEDRLRLALLPELDGGEAFQLAVPLLDQLQLLPAQAQARLFHLVGLVQLLEIGDLQRQPTRRAAQLAGDQGVADLADELERALGLLDLVRAVDVLGLFQDLAQVLGAAQGLQRRHFDGRGRVRANTDAEASGLDHLARDLGIPER